jgi:hypothetical protein
MKRTIIIFGNCQAQMITSCLSSIPLLGDQYEVIWERNVDTNPSWPPRKELLRSQIENCAYLFEQLGRKLIEFPHKDKLPSDCIIIRYPYLKLSCLWPFRCNDPRNKLEPPKYDVGRFPHGDRLIVDWLQKKVPRERLLEKYMNLDICALIDLDQLYQSDLQRIREVDDKCKIRVYNLIKEQFRTKKLFNTIGHPTDGIFKVFLFELLEKSKLIDDNSKAWDNSKNDSCNLADSLVLGIHKFFNQKRFDAFQLPIHPQVCEHFKLRWANKFTTYEYYDYRCLTFEDYIKLYINYE